MYKDGEIGDIRIYRFPPVKVFKYFLLTLLMTVVGYCLMKYLSTKDISYCMVRFCTLHVISIMIANCINFTRHSGSYISNYAFLKTIQYEFRMIFGFLTLFIIGIIVCKVLVATQDTSFSKHIAIFFMFEFFSLSRRKFAFEKIDKVSFYVINTGVSEKDRYIIAQEVVA